MGPQTPYELKRKTEIPYGYCQCGCGGLSPVAKWTNKRYAHIKGFPVRFISGHHNKTRKRNRKGGITQRSDGRTRILKHGHHRANNGYVLRAVFIAENVLGKNLPFDAVIHHFDGNPGNDNNENLVICENRAYHSLLHKRKREKEKLWKSNLWPL